jgi:hypothetical protein
MLMRYSQHFADGHGIVWNIGEAPMDGATDFLFLIAIGVLVKTGLSLEFAARFLGFAAHFLMIGIIFCLYKKPLTRLGWLLLLLVFSVGRSRIFLCGWFFWYHSLCLVCMYELVAGLGYYSIRRESEKGHSLCLCIPDHRIDQT